MIDWLCHPHPITIISLDRAKTVSDWLVDRGNIVKLTDNGRQYEIHFPTIEAEKEYSTKWIL